LPTAVARGPDVAAREPPVLHFEPRAQHVGDAELARQRLDLVPSRRRHQGQGVAAAPVGLHQGARLGVDRRRARAREDALRQLLELLLGHAAQPGRRRGDQRGEADAPELEAQTVRHRAGDVARTHPPAEQAVAQERDRREARDERAVDVEEGAHRGSRGALLDVARDVGGEGHDRGRPEDTSAAIPRSRWAHLPGHLRAWIESAPVAGLPNPSPPLEDAQQWPPAGGRRVVFLLDASSGLERRFLEQWIARARPSGVTPAGYDVVAIPPSRRRRAGRVDSRLEATLATGDDPLLAPLRVAWLPPDADGARAERRRRGARYKVPRFVQEEIVARPAFRGAAARLARSLGRDEASVTREARRYLREIAASHSPRLIHLAANLIRYMYTRGYGETLHYDREQLGDLAALGQRHPLVFLPSHKSNLDSLVLKYALYENGLPPNHTPGRININIIT